MGSNAEIRQRMDTYRSILLVINWIGSVAGIIVGLALISGIGGYAFIIVIVAIFLGIIGHFLINVALAIPYILLNNGDILESMKKNVADNTSSTYSDIGGRTIIGNKLQKKCKRCHKEIDEDYSGCPHCGNNTFE